MKNEDVAISSLREYVNITIKVTIAEIVIVLCKLMFMLIAISIASSYLNPETRQDRTIFVIINILTVAIGALTLALAWVQNWPLLQFMGLRKFVEYRLASLRRWFWQQIVRFASLLGRPFGKLPPKPIALFEFDMLGRNLSAFYDEFLLIKPYHIHAGMDNAAELDMLAELERILKSYIEDHASVRERIAQQYNPNQIDRLREILGALRAAEKVIGIPFAFGVRR